jgi:D-threo-aldose 1-dehydrogenase
MNPTETRKLGKSGVSLTQLGFGGAPLGELFVRVDEATAAATLKAAWDAGVRSDLLISTNL